MSKILKAVVFLIAPVLFVAPLSYSQSILEDPLPKLFVYSTNESPFIYKADDGSVKGPWFNQIKNLLDKTTLDYEIRIVPWSRAYNAVISRENVIVVNLDRLPSREKDFHWLLPLHTRDNNLITRNEEKFRRMTVHQAVKTQGTAVCVKLSATCDLLRSLGFNNKNIWEVETIEHHEMIRLVMRGRADFYIYDFDILKFDLENAGMNADVVISIKEINSITSYLAASNSINPILLERLQAVFN